MNKSECFNCLESEIFVFDALREDEKEHIRHTTSCQAFKKGDLLYRAGDKPQGMMALSTGLVKIFKQGVGGREHIIRLAKPVSFIGYRALLAGQTYASTAIALEDSMTCLIPRQIFFDYMHRNSALSMNIIKYLAMELGVANMRTVSLTQKHLRGRLAETLLYLRDGYGFEKDGKTLNIKLLREDLANLSNMTTSNAIRTLTAFRDENLVSLERRKIKLLDPKSLETISRRG